MQPYSGLTLSVRSLGGTVIDIVVGTAFDHSDAVMTEVGFALKRAPARTLPVAEGDPFAVHILAHGTNTAQRGTTTDSFCADALTIAAPAVGLQTTVTALGNGIGKATVAAPENSAP